MQTTLVWTRRATDEDPPQKVHAVPGQTVFTPPGEEHWHGATPEEFMEHLALLENDDDPSRPPAGSSTSPTMTTITPPESGERAGANTPPCSTPS